MPRLFCTLTLALLLPSLLFAQKDKKSRFKPIPDNARQAITEAVPNLSRRTWLGRTKSVTRPD